MHMAIHFPAINKMQKYKKKHNQQQNQAKKHPPSVTIYHILPEVNKKL